MDDSMNKDQQPGAASSDQPAGSGMPMPGSDQPMGGAPDSSGMPASSDQPMGGASDQSGMPATPPPMGDEAGSEEKAKDGPPHDPMDALDPHPDATQKDDMGQAA